MSDMQGPEGKDRPGPDVPHEKDELGHAPDLPRRARTYGDLTRSTESPSRSAQLTQRWARERPSRSDKIRAWAAKQGIQISARGRIPRDVVKLYEAAMKPPTVSESPTLSRLTERVFDLESVLRKQIAESGIWLTGGGPELDVVKDVGFSLMLGSTPSFRELIAAVSQVDRVITVAAGFAAYNYPDLQIWTGGTPRDLRALEASLQKNGAAWDLEIELLELGSLRLKLKPSGKTIKKVATNSVLVASLLANLATFTGYDVKSAAASSPGKPLPHSVVNTNGEEIPLPPPRQHEVIVHLPPGSVITETIHLSHGKRIEWKFKVGSGGADVAGDWGQ